MSRMQKSKIIKELNKKLQHEDYTTNYFVKYGLIDLFIGKGTLGPEMSWVAQYLTKYLFKHPSLYKEKKVLDMGSGSGIQAITVVIKGAKYILAVDISDYAIRSIKENIKRQRLKNIRCIKSDLFDKVEFKKFDIIIFNHPFIKGKPKDVIKGIYMAEERVIKEFFLKAKDFLTIGGIIIIPFSHLGDYNPKNYADKFNYSIIQEKKFKNKYGKHSIYIMQP